MQPNLRPNLKKKKKKIQYPQFKFPFKVVFLCSSGPLQVPLQLHFNLPVQVWTLGWANFVLCVKVTQHWRRRSSLAMTQGSINSKTEQWNSQCLRLNAMHQVRKHHQGHILTSTGMCSRVQPLTGSMKYHCCTSPSLLARFGTLPLCPLPQNKINLTGCHFVSMKTIQDTLQRQVNVAGELTWSRVHKDRTPRRTWWHNREYTSGNLKKIK